MTGLEIFKEVARRAGQTEEEINAFIEKAKVQYAGTVLSIDREFPGTAEEEKEFIEICVKNWHVRVAMVKFGGIKDLKKQTDDDFAEHHSKN